MELCEECDKSSDTHKEELSEYPGAPPGFCDKCEEPINES